MSSTPSITELLKSAKQLQGQVSAMQKTMEKEHFTHTNDYFTLVMNGERQLQTLSFLAASKELDQETLAKEIVKAHNVLVEEVKKKTKLKIADLSKGILPSEE